MRIDNFRELSAQGPVVATFDLYIPAVQMTINGCKIIRSKKGNLFPNLPSYPVTDEMGKKTYHPVLTFQAERQAEFDRLLKRELEPYLTNR